jgi:predicted NUDIX family phosphoesterase
MSKLDEIVWAIRVSELTPDNTFFEGYQRPPDPTILNKIYNNCMPISRRNCENDPKLKHIIPYCTITSKTNHIFVTKRTNNQTEARLHGKASIGIGGHVGPCSNMGIKDSVHVGMLRELQEEVTGMDEVGASFNFMPRLVGLLNYNGDSVGQVHLGLVYELLVDPDRMQSVNVKETENMTGQWMPYKDASNIKNYETWSSLILGLM